MLTVSKEAIHTFFKEYTDRYNASDPKIRLKIDHTYRVAEIAEQIATQEQLSKEMIELSWLCGMLHDIGRFEQIKRYGTFVDAESIDHATFGADILFKEGLIQEIFIPSEIHSAEMSWCQSAIRYHSIYQLPQTLSETERTLCNILRDADKIDILRVNLDTPMEVIYNTTSETLKRDSISPEVMQAFAEHHAVLRSLKKTAIDNLVGHAAMIFELTYGTSKRLVDEQGYLWELLSYPSENPKTQEFLSYMKQELQTYIQSSNH